MIRSGFATSFTVVALTIVGTAGAAEPITTGKTPLEYIFPKGQHKPSVPISPAVKAGNILYVSGTPAYDKSGKFAVGDFPAQMNQVMENISETLKSAGTGWDRVVKVNVFLKRREDFKEMNRIYATYFQNGRYPARTTAVVVSLPQPDALLEIECEAVIQ